MLDKATRRTLAEVMATAEPLKCPKCGGKIFYTYGHGSTSRQKYKICRNQNCRHKMLVFVAERIIKEIE